MRISLGKPPDPTAPRTKGEGLRRGGAGGVYGSEARVAFLSLPLMLAASLSPKALVLQCPGLGSRVLLDGNCPSPASRTPMSQMEALGALNQVKNRGSLQGSSSGTLEVSLQPVVSWISTLGFS